MASSSTDTLQRVLAIIAGEGVANIPLGRDRFALIDKADEPQVSQHKWIFASRGYAFTRIDGVVMMMHRFIMDASADAEVDHIDGDGLNNQRYNLRVCSRAENAKNRHTSTGRSRFKGVWRDRSSWRATIWSDGKRSHLGSFVSERKAARAYDKAARELHGEFACTNEDLGLY
jgi:hypothetical protein